MDLHEIRNALKTKNMQDIPLRVTFYARVSSESDEQLNSLGNQISYYENYIKKNTAWTFVPGYIDEGISGISTKHRENFNRMIDDAEKGLFDLIITKEISRFARNTLDSIQYTRQLLNCGVGVYFQNDGIRTFDDDAELRLTIMASIAQDELRKLSSRIKFGHQQAIKNNVVLGNSRIFGYKKENKRLVIDDKEAEMVRELYTLYASDKYSMKAIEKIFWDKGYRNRNGNRIAHSTMANIISNPKYKGYYVGNKVKIVDMFTKKQKFLPPEEWVMFKDETGQIVPAIVSEETWDKANEILKRRSDDVKYRQGICNHANILTGKLFCTQCGLPYYRKDSKSKTGEGDSRWVCSGKIKNGKDSCDSFTIYESELIPIIFDVFKSASSLSKEMISEYEKMYKSLTQDGNIDKAIDDEKQKIEKLIKKKDKLLELVAEGNISNADFKTMTERCNGEIQAVNETINELENQRKSSEEFYKHMEKVKTALRAAEEDVSKGKISREFIDGFINKIYVTPETSDCARVDIQIFTGDNTSAYLNRLNYNAKKKDNLTQNNESEAGSVECRTGHIFLTIWPPTEPASREVRSPLYPCLRLTPTSEAASILNLSRASRASGTMPLELPFFAMLNTPYL